ncbi:MAG: DNA mismatch repair protein MutS, partial [Planctomycetes bacterium]|nr:DNA mismatch repair protein MutS [Planctomycetota bacterium]
DAVASLAHVAADEGYVAPEIIEEAVLDVVNGRHPVVSAGHARSDFTPNDVQLGGDRPALAVITGPNMAGKSTYIRQAALITILAQIGSYVPAERARVGLADRIFTRVGAADDLTRGQSTFMVEMTETANILNNATARSLVILDEVGRGTSTLDGVSLAWAIAEHLIEESGARALFATHYHELTELEERFAGRVSNLNVSVKEWQDQIVFLHKIVPGGTDKAYGIHVARLAGIPESVLDRAKTILTHFEAEHASGQHVPVATPTSSTGSTSTQLDLFGNAYDDLDRALRKIDVDRTTPVEALVFLSELRKLLP